MAIDLSKEQVKRIAFTIIIAGAIITLLVYALIIFVAIPGFVNARQKSKLYGCQENQAKLEGAVLTYMLDHGLENLSETPFAGKPASDPSVQEFLIGPDNYLDETPICESGGNYHILPTEKQSDMTSVYCDHMGTDGKPAHPYPSHYE